MQPQKTNDVLGTANRGTPAESGLCTLCRADCAGKCETWLSCLRGRDMLYPRDFGAITAGSANTEHQGVSYASLRLAGRVLGPGDDAERMFTGVNLSTTFGRGSGMAVGLPIITGALGSTRVAAVYWNGLAVGCALCGVPLVIGENVAGIDPKAEFTDGRLKKAPELSRRIAVYRQYATDTGGILVQQNVEDSRNGLAEFLAESHADEVAVELKWGQGAKSIGGEIKVGSIEQARFLKSRGYVVDPDPDDPSVSQAFADGAVRAFARHSRLGHADLGNFERLREQFLTTVDRLRALGFSRITLKTGAYGMEGLAMAVKCAAEAGLDLLTIDGAGGGTGMSPWNMMDHWGVPSLFLHAKAREFADALSQRGIKPADMAFGGGFAREDHIVKALALGAPYARLACLGRALMIPAFVGANIEGVLFPEKRAAVHGLWDSLPKVVAERGATPEAIFAGYHALRERLGEAETRALPLGAIAFCTLMDKLGAGIQQFLAGMRRFAVTDLSRSDVLAANRETAHETGLEHMAESGLEQARRILEA
ncbi:MAG: glutamate synthase-related protein [Desulfovibrionaceae bacterium]|nr:glutamate synthase-related protein [Desulfovibrionaceae bacterium]